MTSSASLPLRSTHPLAIEWQTGAVILVAVHFLVWSWVGIAARSNLDSPGDMVEAYVWGQSFAWGYFKHPPLSAWIAGAWFRVWPEGDTGFAVLAALNAAVGLAGLAVLLRRLLPADWALLALAAASLTPGITTMALRFNANAVLVSTWPWAAAFFVAMMQDGRRRDAFLCGLACALALLGKYYSVVLVATLVACALAVPPWRRRLSSAPPWIALATMAIAFAPHAAWALAQREGPLQYAHSAALLGRASAGLRALRFGLAQWALQIPAFVLLAIAFEPGRRGAALRGAAAALLRPRREAAWLLAALPIAFTMAGTLALGARTSTVWGLPIAGFVTALLVLRARAAGATIDLRRAALAMPVAWALVAAAAPTLWLFAAEHGWKRAGEPRAELAAAVDELWRAQTGRALPWVSGTRKLAASVAFYAADHPRYWSVASPALETPWVALGTPQAVGGAVVCADADEECRRAGAAFATQPPHRVTVAKHARGFDFEPHAYWVYLAEPPVP